MKTFAIEIRGKSPYLMCRFGEAAEFAGPTSPGKPRHGTPREEAEKVQYVRQNGEYYFSSFSITGALGNAGSNHKMKGTRKSLRFVIPSAVRVVDDTITLLDPDTGKPCKSWEVDSRSVVIPSTKGRVMRHRPRFDRWGAKFMLEIEDDVIDAETVHQLLNEAGLRVGIGDFRPEKRGPFGRFMVVSFKEFKDVVR